LQLRKLVGLNIRYYRRQKGLTQEALAYKAKLHPNYLSELERGNENVSIDTLERICKVLGVEVREIFSEAYSNLNKKAGNK